MASRKSGVDGTIPFNNAAERALPASRRRPSQSWTLRRIRAGGRARSRYVHSDRDRKAQRRRSAGLARRCPRPSSRPSRQTAGRPTAMELVTALRRSKGRLITRHELTSLGLHRMRTMHSRRPRIDRDHLRLEEGFQLWQSLPSVGGRVMLSTGSALSAPWFSQTPPALAQAPTVGNAVAVVPAVKGLRTLCSLEELRGFQRSHSGVGRRGDQARVPGQDQLTVGSGSTVTLDRFVYDPNTGQARQLTLSRPRAPFGS